MRGVGPKITIARTNESQYGAGTGRKSALPLALPRPNGQWALSEGSPGRRPPRQRACPRPSGGREERRAPKMRMDEDARPKRVAGPWKAKSVVNGLICNFPS